MESIDISQPNPTDSLVPNTGQQSDTFPSNPLQLPNPDSNHSGSGKDPSLSDEAALNAATWFAEQQLDSFTSDEDFLDNMEQAFGNDWQSQQAEDLIQDLASGDAMPKVEILPASELKANGAYGENTIYLSEEFLSNASSEKVSGALLEEIGHYVDQELNSGDSPGDEGEIFQQLVQDEAISEGELVELKAEDDSGTIALDGEEISVEQASPDYRGYLLEYEPGEPLEDRPAVKEWQNQLVDLDYDIGEAGVDGFYGSDTEEATKEFQEEQQIMVDGIVGPETWKAAFSDSGEAGSGLPREMKKNYEAKVENLVPELEEVLPDIVEAYEDSGTGNKPFITSGHEGREGDDGHSEGSAHYTNEAIDLVGYKGETYTERMSAEDLKDIAETIITGSSLKDISDSSPKPYLAKGNWDQNEDGAPDFRVLLENLGRGDQHIHIDIHPENSISTPPADNLPNNHVLENDPGEPEYDSYVEDWQERMNKLGWSNKEDGLKEDGLYGPNSEKIAREFQDAAGISEDGKVGPETWDASFEPIRIG